MPVEMSKATKHRHEALRGVSGWLEEEGVSRRKSWSTVSYPTETVREHWKSSTVFGNPKVIADFSLSSFRSQEEQEQDQEHEMKKQSPLSR